MTALTTYAARGLRRYDSIVNIVDILRQWEHLFAEQWELLIKWSLVNNNLLRNVAVLTNIGDDRHQVIFGFPEMRRSSSRSSKVQFKVQILLFESVFIADFLHNLRCTHMEISVTKFLLLTQKQITEEVIEWLESNADTFATILIVGTH